MVGNLSPFPSQFAVEYGKEVKYFDSARVVQGAVKHQGRPPAFLPADALGLALHWLLSPCQEKYLCLIFGAVPAVLNRVKNDALNALYRALGNNVHAAIRWPNTVQVPRVRARLHLPVLTCSFAMS